MGIIPPKRGSAPLNSIYTHFESKSYLLSLLQITDLFFPLYTLWAFLDWALIKSE